MLPSAVRVAICADSEWTRFGCSSSHQESLSDLFGNKAAELAAAQNFLRVAFRSVRKVPEHLSIWDVQHLSLPERSEAAGFALPEVCSARDPGTEVGLPGLIVALNFAGVADGATSHIPRRYIHARSLLNLLSR